MIRLTLLPLFVFLPGLQNHPPFFLPSIPTNETPGALVLVFLWCIFCLFEQKAIPKTHSALLLVKRKVKNGAKPIELLPTPPREHHARAVSRIGFHPECVMIYEVVINDAARSSPSGQEHFPFAPGRGWLGVVGSFQICLSKHNPFVWATTKRLQTGGSGEAQKIKILTSRRRGRRHHQTLPRSPKGRE